VCRFHAHPARPYAFRRTARALSAAASDFLLPSCWALRRETMREARRVPTAGRTYRIHRRSSRRCVLCQGSARECRPSVAFAAHFHAERRRRLRPARAQAPPTMIAAPCGARERHAAGVGHKMLPGDIQHSAGWRVRAARTGGAAQHVRCTCARQQRCCAAYVEGAAGARYKAQRECRRVKVRYSRQVAVVVRRQQRVRVLVR